MLPTSGASPTVGPWDSSASAPSAARPGTAVASARPGASAAPSTCERASSTLVSAWAAGHLAALRAAPLPACLPGSAPLTAAAAGRAHLLRLQQVQRAGRAKLSTHDEGALWCRQQLRRVAQQGGHLAP